MVRGLVVVEREFEPIYEREVVDYELPVQFGSEVVNLVINVDNTVVVTHTDTPEMDHLLVLNPETQQMTRLWKQPQNEGLFKQLPEMGFDTWAKKIAMYEDQEAYLKFIMGEVSIERFFGTE